MASHTGARWQFDGNHGVYAGSYRIAAIDGTMGILRQDAIANARLIASAPELMAALEMARLELKHLAEIHANDKPELDGSIYGISMGMLAAIRAARGEA